MEYFYFDGFTVFTTKLGFSPGRRPLNNADSKTLLMKYLMRYYIGSQVVRDARFNVSWDSLTPKKGSQSKGYRLECMNYPKVAMFDFVYDAEGKHIKSVYIASGMR